MLTDAIANLEFQVDDPNNRLYNAYNLGTWSSVSQVNTFLNRFNHASGYKDGNTKLAVGNYVTIQDGKYNSVWEIAGFDMEHNQYAADGTVYDNGYGICLIPQTQLTGTAAAWNGNNTVKGGYKASTIHTSVLPAVVSKLENVLGSHIVNRNVLLSSSVSGYSDAYTWTTSKATLMSIGQMTGTFAKNSTKYDDGEANYRLPIFNFKEYKTGSTFWSRGIWGGYGTVWYAWSVFGDGNLTTGLDKGDSPVTNYFGIRPLIYLR